MWSRVSLYGVGCGVGLHCLREGVGGSSLSGVGCGVGLHCLREGVGGASLSGVGGGVGLRGRLVSKS